jgi:AraC-like DNA-binding protein
VWSPTAAGTTHDCLPDATSALTFRAAAGGARGDLTASGAVSRAAYKRVPGELFAISVIFEPGGAYPFFGVPMRALADRRVPLEELWGPEASRLVERLLECRDEARAVQMLEQALVARLEREEHLELRSAVHVLRVVRRVVSDQPGIDVAGLAMRVGLSQRQLRRVFATAVGVGPKEYLQMLRFNRAAAQSATMPGGQLATAAGYYDQAHLIAEFQHLAGMTPREFANRRRPGARALPGLTPQVSGARGGFEPPTFGL